MKWGPLVQGDIRDGDRLSRIFTAYRPQAVLHFAADASVAESVADPGTYYDNNLGGTLALLGTMRRHGCRRLVFSSTCAVYGRPDAMPITEATPAQPVNPYGRSKWLVEQVLRDLSESGALHFVSLRYFNAAGADREGELGESHDPEHHLIPNAVATALGRREWLDVYGDDYATPDGTAIRDYVHVEDLAEAHLRALGHVLAGGASEALNLGTGHGHSVLEVVRAIEGLAGASLPMRRRPRRAGDPDRLVAAAERAAEVLGWKPRRSRLADIVASAWRWHARTQGTEEAVRFGGTA